MMGFMGAIRIMVCDDDKLFRDAIALCIKKGFKREYELTFAENGDQALEVINRQSTDVLFLDIKMRTADEGLTYLPRIREADPDITVVMSSGFTDLSTVRKAIQLGAADYIPKNFQPDDLIHTLELALDRRRLLLEREKSSFEVKKQQSQNALIGESQPIQNLRKVIQKAKNSSHNVLITGETGTGKEVVARLLRSEMPDGNLAPFVPVDSATIQSSMAESLLFGHEKGAFTGADKLQKGLFEEADGGTIYFDELSNMPLDIQAKLLRVIQEKEFTRLGSTKVIKSNFRVIAATNCDLDQAVAKGQFKADLLQRLKVIPIALPPLREREKDVPLLIAHFTKVHGSPKNPAQFSMEALEVLGSYVWPGNVRELSNVIAYVLTMSENSEILISDLPPQFRSKAIPNHVTSEKCFYDQVENFERELLSREHARLQGNISKMALELGMDRSHLHSKLKALGIRK